MLLSLDNQLLSVNEKVAWCTQVQLCTQTVQSPTQLQLRFGLNWHFPPLIDLGRLFRLRCCKVPNLEGVSALSLPAVLSRVFPLAGWRPAVLLTASWPS